MLLVWLAACSDETALQQAPADVPAQADVVSFAADVAPLLDSRCVACHACYDAPCQLKLTAYEGVVRGATKARVYASARLREAPLTRLFFDGHTEQDWRDKGFFSVLSAGDNRDAGILSATLAQKMANPLPARLTDELPLDDPASWSCAADMAQLQAYANANPLGGMPYALPGLSEQDVATINGWIAQGARDDSDYTLTATERRMVGEWETFLNQDGFKARLAARYIYEHLFLANLYFAQGGGDRYFQLVRSRTPPGQPPSVIATRRPFDDPGVDRVYYRLRLNRETVVAKTHMPYRLNRARLQDWQKWFIDADYTVTSLPGYAIETSANPFKTFAALPVQARYRLMLSEANFTVKGFIKGPVCKGPSAVNVINEHFWVFFVEPDQQAGAAMVDYLAQAKDDLDLPAEKQDTLRIFSAWDEFADKEKDFLHLRRAFIKKHLNDDGHFDLSMIWDGEGSNPNAALTVFRHHDHASVHKGLIGQAPKTAWVIDYPLLERIHYLLIAGYDVYGNVSHQLLSRIYMDFLRMEGESMFLLLLPPQVRREIRSFWYREADERINEFMALTDLNDITSGVVSANDPTPQQTLYQALAGHLDDAMYPHYRFASPAQQSDPVVQAIEVLQRQSNDGFMHLPHVTLLQVKGGAAPRYFSVIKNVGHLNNTSVLFEGMNIAPGETGVTLVPGFVGPRPYAFMQLQESEFAAYARALGNLQTEADYIALIDRFGVRRTDPRFWQVYDEFHAGFLAFSPRDYGVLDLTKLENR